ncbi:transporter substrate-binding domain-containing protein [Butyrivibrio sp. XBB1001]|uniref:transporter substrate-binding domain-containing protein n=1 Tax=Butyrivibrio sp. XBB1001 TaxID=1280682 RepID=UPI00040D65B7|nr:transporter substrate-binding domain-containing protein [Butyrivibrio sp. XBB1001]
MKLFENKRFLGITVATTMLAGVLAGCGNSSETTTTPSEESVVENSVVAETPAETVADTAADQLASIKEKGKIIIAMEGQWAPWTYHDESGELVGFDTEVGKEIAKRLGVEAEFVEGEWDGLFAGLDGGRYDCIINGVEITDLRKEKYDFTTPYAFIRTALVVKDDNTEITTFDDLKGKKTSNSLGSTYADMAADLGADVQNVDTLSETIDMVLSGRVDATLNAEVSFYDYLGEHPDAPIKIVALTDEASEVSIPLRKGDESASLRAAIDEAIQEMAADGTLSELSTKYFGQDITK